MVNAAHHRFSFAEYVELVEDSRVKLEFLDGQVWAMSGGSPDHARVTANVTMLLAAALRGRPCAVYSPDLRIRSKATGLGTYADVTVICGQVELDPLRHEGGDGDQAPELERGDELAGDSIVRRRGPGAV